MSKALEDIAAERQRQIGQEGWTLEHDDQHSGGAMAFAAAAYAIAGHRPYSEVSPTIKGLWPWDMAWWKPTGGARRCLVKAGALIVAEIERLDRAASKTKPQT